MVGVVSSIPSGGQFIFADFETPRCQLCTKMPEMSDLLYLGKTRLYQIFCCVHRFSLSSFISFLVDRSLSDSYVNGILFIQSAHKNQEKASRLMNNFFILFPEVTCYIIELDTELFHC